MNEQIATSPKPSGEHFDLAYIETLGHQERRASAFYEYARHSSALKDLITQLRREGYFAGKPGSPELKKLLLPLMSSGVFRGDELLMLVECDSFPDMPFNESARYRELFGTTAQSFGIKPPCFMPWHVVDALSGGMRRKGLNDLEMLENANLHVAYLPWEDYTDAEIIEMLSERVPSLRPRRAPGPGKSGRGGRTKSLGTVDMLHQLAAYRQHVAGNDFSMGGPLCRSAKGDRLYTTLEGWSQAIDTAKSRIIGMMDRPFFGPL